MLSNRPTGITIISAYYLIYGLASLLFNLIKLPIAAVTICFAPGMLGGGIWGIIVGVLNIILAAALWSGRDWSRLVVTILAVIGIATGILAGLSGGFGLGLIINIAINAVVLFYMQSAEVQRFMRAR
jgi:hypothetical protein